MDINAAKSLYSSTFGSPASAAKAKRVTPVEPVKQAYQTPQQHKKESQPLTYDLKSLQASKPRNVSATTNTSAPQSINVQQTAKNTHTVYEQKPDRASSTYLDVAKAKPFKYNIDTFA